MAKENNNAKSEDLRELIESTSFALADDNLKIAILTLYAQLQSDRMQKHMGLMGKVFGDRSENIARYIAFLIIVLLISVGLIYILLPLEYKETTNEEFWQIIGPIITGALGYIFGSSMKK